jgi:hypothetical protein
MTMGYTVLILHRLHRRLRSRHGLCAFAGFSRDPSAVIRNPSFEGANQSKEARRDLKRKAHLPQCRRVREGSTIVQITL